MSRFPAGSRKPGSARHAWPVFSPIARLAVLSLACLTLLPDVPQGLERRRDQFGKDFGYFIYPIASDIPGLGQAVGAGATVLNMFETDADFTGFKLQGDFDASGYALLDLHLMPRTLILDLGVFDYRVAPPTYGRGIDSDRDDFILPEVEGEWTVGQITLSFAERMFEAYYRLAEGSNRLVRVLDKEGNEFEAIDSSRRDARQMAIGAILDITDDRLDPREGFRLELLRRFPEVDDGRLSEYHVTDTNVTGYIPFRRWDTLALNFFLSDAEITRTGITDFETLRREVGLGCDQIPAGPAQDQCLVTEEKRIEEVRANNINGRATSLGGTQRLRGYPNYRFYAGHAVFYGAEYRWNLNEERVPFDFYIARGVRTGFQLAFFAEQGSVADDRAKLFDDMRSSYGLGFRILLSGVIIRADWATGEEGAVFQLFINYPWSMFSVDSPG